MSSSENVSPDTESKYDDSIFKDAQKHIDQINKRVQDLFENKYKKAYQQLEETSQSRDLVWKRYVLSEGGLADRCRQLHRLLQEVEETKPDCDAAQEEFNRKGIVNAAGDNIAEKSVDGCADTNYTTELRSKRCENVGEPLLCSWLRSKVIPSLHLDEYFLPPMESVWFFRMRNSIRA